MMLPPVIVKELSLPYTETPPPPLLPAVFPAMLPDASVRLPPPSTLTTLLVLAWLLVLVMTPPVKLQLPDELDARHRPLSPMLPLWMAELQSQMVK